MDALGLVSARIEHRGPDGDGIWSSPQGEVALAHRRLAIIDLTPASAQPMVDAVSGVALSYNGELYNFVALRSELEGLGHRFTTRGDVEVVLRALVEWREHAFARFAGMFAISAWDPRDGTLWLARDAMGMKPLYLASTPMGVAFASEVKALLALPEVTPRLDPHGLAEYMEFGFRLSETATMFKGIERLAPGEVLGLRAGRIVRRFRHFEPPLPDAADQRGGDERARALLETLEQVVAEHLVADVPVGLLLSGGLDSSLVAALAAKTTAVTTVSMGFTDSDHDERPWAQRVAEAIGSRHLDVAITPDEVRAEVEEGAWVFDDLFADWGTITTRILYRRCRELGLKVALVGEGSDEIFGGYSQFRRSLRRSSLRVLATLYRGYISRRWGHLFGEFRAIYRELLRETGDDLFEATRRFESRRQLPGNYVMKVDKASMSVSLEARAPYLDRRIAEIAFRTPAEWLVRDGTEKWLLRRAAAVSGALPDEIVGRPKKGGSIAASWLDDHAQFRTGARERVLRCDGFADRLGLRRPMERYFAGEKVLPLPHRISHLGVLAWRLLLLELWAPHFGVESVA